MYTLARARTRLEEVFEKGQAQVLAQVITDAYSELVKTSDFNELKEIVRDLAEAQKQTEHRLDRLTSTVEELAEAQRRTENELHELVLDHKETRRQLGGLARTVVYGLENQAYKGLPRLLERDFGIVVTAGLRRQWVQDNTDAEIEVNIVGEGISDGKKITIIGECKSHLSKNKVDDFIRKKLKRLEGVFDEVFPLVVTDMTSSSSVENYVKEQGIALYYSYDWE
jgi:3-keto-L-gulonate-6-phosphate decarboxylase